MANIRAEIRRARPHLYVIAPLTFWVLCCFVGLNTWIAVTFFKLDIPAVPPVEGGILGNLFWGVIFLLMAFSLGWGIATKNWGLARVSMMFGLFIKSIFLYALIAEGLKLGFVPLLGTIGLWLFAVAVQLGAVIYFSPPRTPELGSTTNKEQVDAK